MDFKGAAEVTEVVPCCLCGDETARNIEAGVVINGKQQDLFGGGRPPLMNGTVVLIKFANPCTAEAPVGPLFSQRSRDEMREVGFDIDLDAGSSPLETAEPLHFVRHKLVVGRVLQWQEVFKESADLCGPGAAAATATGFGLVRLPVVQKVGAELIEPGFADAKMLGRSRCVQYPIIEIGENAEDKNGRQAVNDLFLFKTGISFRAGSQCDQKGLASCAAGGELAAA